MRLKGIRDSTFDFLLLIDNGVFSGVKMELVDFLSGNVSMEIECEGNVKIKVLTPVTPVVNKKLSKGRRNGVLRRHSAGGAPALDQTVEFSALSHMGIEPGARPIHSVNRLAQRAPAGSQLQPAAGQRRGPTAVIHGRRPTGGAFPGQRQRKRRADRAERTRDRRPAVLADARANSTTAG